jgi:hypothetical protein
MNSCGAYQVSVRIIPAAQLCQELTALINQRLMQHPEAETALDACVDELKQLGHDLWSYGDFWWSAAYVTPRAGAGLRIRPVNEDDDGEKQRCLVVVTFARSEGE